MSNSCCNDPRSILHVMQEKHKQQRPPKENHTLQTIKGSELLQCIRCGFTVETKADLPETCTPFLAKPMPHLTQQLLHFAEAIKEAILHGIPTCDRQEIEERHEQCCPRNAPPCKYYHPVAQACTSCGCHVNLFSFNEGLNKLAWKEETCPLEKW